MPDSPDQGADRGVVRFITDAWPLVALGVIGALIIRACVPVHPPVQPAGAFDPQTGVRVGNWHAMSALQALTAESGSVQVLGALNLLVIDFSATGSKLPDSAEPVLTRVAAVIEARPTSERYEITAYSERMDSPLADLDLSRRRAQAVVDFLIKQGVPTRRLQARGAGDQDPVAGEPGEESSFRNQHLQFALLP